MGMFDYLRVEAELPGGMPKLDDGRFQTKDLDCELETHRITADGRLMVTRVVRYDPVPESEWKHRDAADGSIEAVWHEMSKRAPVRQEFEEPWHGYIDFGGLEVVGHEPADWHPGGQRPLYRHHDYRAKFTDGRLVEIVKLPEWKPEAEGNK